MATTLLWQVFCQEGVCAAAASGGSLEVLTWARAQGCEWQGLTTTAAEANRLDVLQWAHRRASAEPEPEPSAGALQRARAMRRRRAETVPRPTKRLMSRVRVFPSYSLCELKPYACITCPLEEKELALEEIGETTLS